MAKKVKETKAPKSTKKIEFILSPTGAYNLAYNVGDVAEFETNKADEIINNGYAKEVK